MARKRIQGITIELDGETKGLDKALKDVNKRSSDLNSELREVERALKFNPGNADLIAQQQEILAQQVENSTKKLGQLRDAQKQVEAQFQRGDIGEEQYRAFRREIVKTESQLDGFKKKYDAIDDGKAADNVKKDMQDIKKESNEAEGAVGELGSALGGLAAGVGAAGAIDQALDFSNLDTQIDISFNVPDDSKEAVKQAIKDVSAYGTDAEEALEGVRRQWALNAEASDESNAKIVQGAATISAAYAGIDFTELVQEANEIGSALNITNEEALGLTDSLLKAGFPPEQIDIIAEYGTQLQMAGYEAEEIQAIFSSGVDTKTWNIDNLLDGLKEGNVRLKEFGDEVPEAVGELLEGTKISAEQLQEWGKAVAKGGDTGKQAMSDVANALSSVEDETKRSQLGVQLFGTMYEDQGEAITDVLTNAENATFDLKEGTDGLTESISQMDESPAVQLKNAFNDLKTALGPLLEQIAEFVSEVAEWVSQNPKLTATILAVVSAVGILTGMFMALAPVITVLSAAAGALGIGLAPLIGIVAAVVAGIGLLVTAGIMLWKNWEKIKTMAQVIWGAIANFFQNTLFPAIKTLFNGFLNWIDEKTNGKFKSATDAIRKYMEMAWDNIKRVWQFIKDSFSNALDFISSLLKGDFEGMWDAVKEQMGNIEDTIGDIWGNVEDFFESIDLREIGSDIMQGLINGISSMREAAWEAAKGVAQEVKNSLMFWTDSHSPSRMAMEIGGFVGEGLVIGLKSMTGSVNQASKGLAQGMMRSMADIADSVFRFEGNNPLAKYFNAILEDGDWMNDWATHLPNSIRDELLSVGKQFAQFEGMRTPQTQSDGDMVNLVGAINKLAGRDNVLVINDREFARSTGNAMALELQNMKVSNARGRGIRK